MVANNLLKIPQKKKKKKTQRKKKEETKRHTHNTVHACPEKRKSNRVLWDYKKIVLENPPKNK